MATNFSIRKWKILFNSGAFYGMDRNTQINAGWWDWFCKDSSLRNKTYKMGKIISQINGNGKVDLDKNYVWFKNNCPLSGPLYDDFRFADLEDGEVQMTIQIDCCWNNKKYAVFGRKEKGGKFGDEPLFECDNSKELVKWFNESWDK